MATPMPPEELSTTTDPRAHTSWAIHDLPLVLIGDGDLAPVVSRLHALALGPSVGLIVYDDGDPAAAIDGAHRGVLCVMMHRQAPMVRLVELLRETEQGTRPQLVLCTGSSSEAAALSVKLGRCAVISLPDLSTRKDELEDVRFPAGSRTTSDELETTSRSTGSNTLTVSRRIQAFHGATEK